MYAKVVGAEQLAIVAARLKVAGAVELRRELLVGLRAGAQPLIPKVRAAALEQLPKRGGLNVRVAGEPMSVRIRTGGRSPSVRIVTKTSDTGGADRGVIRHPVFGHRDRKWSSQPYVPAKGYFSETLTREAPQVRHELILGVESVNRRVTRPL